jgi:serine/threonine protein kinase
MQSLGVTVVEELGRGTSGIVYKVLHLVDRKHYVVKVIDISQSSSKKQAQALKEVEILKQVNNFHIIKYYNSIVHNQMLYILMEYAQGGDLQKKINRYKSTRRNIDEPQIWNWAYEISLAVKYLHRHKILHRDIKCMNIFLDKDNRVKLGDLGLSKILVSKEIDCSAVGTPLYLSPEQIRHQPYGFKVDVWGIGCVLYTLCALESPFGGNSLLTLGQNIAMRSPRSLPTKYSPKLVSFINTLLEKNPKNRPNIKEAIELIPIYTKKFYKKPLMLEESTVKKNDTSIDRIYEENSNSDSIFPRFSSQVMDKSMQLSLKKSLPIENESRPTTQATKRLLVASSDAVRVCTAYIKHRYIKIDKPKTTINDLARIM